MDWMISWDMLGEDTAVHPSTAFVTNGFRVQNLSTTAKTFDILVAFASAPTPASSWDGEALLGGLLTSDASGSAASLTSSGALWVGQINGISHSASALMNATSLSAAFGTSTIFGPVSSASAGIHSGAISSIGYRMQFTLGAKSTAVFTGSWEVVPTPGALSLLGVAGVIGRRRRTN
jgi:hypothetical protein